MKKIPRLTPCHAPLTGAPLQRLLTGAILGCQKAFLTQPGGTRHGAAVLTATGELFNSGQYASFNHATHIHAEMAAIVRATMHGAPDIVALAIVSDRAHDKPARPCGVCREFMHEHCKRTGRDLLVVMANFNGTRVEQCALTELLSKSWAPTPQIVQATPWPPLPFSSDTCPEGSPAFGDLVQSEDQLLSMVWAPQWTPGVTLMKVKYDGTLPPSPNRKVHKLPHSFSQYQAYLAQLEARHIETRLPWGDPAMMVSTAALHTIMPAPPLTQERLSDLRPFLSILAEAGIPTSSCRLTGSRALGMASDASDFDIVIEANPSAVALLRQHLTLALRTKALHPPSQSSTWKRLPELTGRDGDSLVSAGRFVETFDIDGTKCSLIFVSPSHRAPIHSAPPTYLGACTITGTVIEALEGPFKPGHYRIQAEGGITKVVCWHKLSMLLKVGDLVTITGHLCQVGEDETRLHQIDSARDSIHWLNWRD